MSIIVVDLNNASNQFFPFKYTPINHYFFTIFALFYTPPPSITLLLLSYIFFAIPIYFSHIILYLICIVKAKMYENITKPLFKPFLPFGFSIYHI